MQDGVRSYPESLKRHPLLLQPMSRKTSFSHQATAWSRMLCILLAFLIPAQCATALALQAAGPAHTHQAAAGAPLKHAAHRTSGSAVLEHRGHQRKASSGFPPGFEWAAALRAHAGHAHHVGHAGSPHVHAPDHGTERHHHGEVDGTVLLDTDSSTLDSGIDWDGKVQGSTSTMAWAPPSFMRRWPHTTDPQPSAAAAALWRDHLSAPLDRPPRTA